MRKYQLENPSNARIFVNFNDKKNPVRFSYPSKMSAFRMAGYTFYTFWMQIFFIAILPIIVLLAILLHSLMILWITLIAYPIIPIALAFIFSHNKKLILLLPKINKWVANGDLKEIIVEKLDSNVYEIPIFDNVFLEYIATEDFGKYLSKIEVTEYDFYYLKRKFFSRKLEKIQNDEFWKAQFIFSEIPKKGELKINFI